MESRSRNSRRNIAAGMISSFFTPLMGFLIRTALIYVFNEQYSGVISVFTSILSVLNLAELGFSSAIIVNLYEPLEKDNIRLVCAILNYYRIVYRIIGGLIFLFGITLLPFLSLFIQIEGRNEVNIYILYIIYLVDTSVSYFMFSYKSALLTAIQRFDIVKKISILSYALKGILQLYAILISEDIYLYVGVSIISTVINNLLLQYVSKMKYPLYTCTGRIERSQKKLISRQVLGLSISKITEVARNSFDSIVLSAYLGLSVVTAYNNYFYIYNTVLTTIWIFVQAIQASVGNSIVSESVEKNYNDLRKIEFVFGFIISICTALMVCLYQPFMMVWMKGKLLLGSRDMILFVIYFYCISINGVRNLYFQGVGLWWKGRKYAIFEAISNLILNLIMGYYWGITGILLATICTIVCVNYVCNTNLLFREYFRMSPKNFYLDRIYYTFVTIVGCVAAYCACMPIVRLDFYGLIMTGIICLLISLAVILTIHIIFKRKITFESIKLFKTVFLTHSN